MKKLFLFLLLFLIITYTKAQKFTFGIESGVNFSNIHQEQGTDHIDGLPGPINGLFAKYELLPWLVIQSGVNHTTSYFYQKSYNYYPDYYIQNLASGSGSDFSPNIIAPPYYSYKNQHFSFLRMPLLVKLKTSGRLSAEFGGGVYYALVTNDAFRGKDSELYADEYIKENFPPLNDWGSVLAGSLSFQINKQLSVFAAAQVTNAKSYFLKSEAGKIGSSELTFGIGYTPFGNKSFTSESDSTPSEVILLPHAGISLSMAHASNDNEEYLNKPGFSGGVSVKWMLDKTVSFNSGVWFERKGYGLEYAGNYDFIYLPALENNSDNTSNISSDINLDYLTLPFLFEFSTGKKFRSDFSTGCYFSCLQNAYARGERTDTYRYESGYSITKNYFDNDIDQWIKNWDAGLMFGYRLEYSALKKGGVFLGVNQTIGLVNLFENLDEIQNPPHSIGNQKIFNHATTFMAGVFIPLSK